MNDLDAAFEALRSFDWGSDPAALGPIVEAVRTTHGQAAARLELENRLLAALEGTPKRAVQDFVCRQLMTVGTAASVPLLRGWLTESGSSHLARFALERIPGQEAGRAMLDALAQTSGPVRTGIAASLGSRAESGSVETLAALLAGDDPAVSIAAAASLGEIRNRQAAEALAGAKPGVEAVAMAVVDARLHCAEGLLKGGAKAEARAIYQSLATSDLPKHVKLAATRGLLACAGGE